MHVTQYTLWRVSAAAVAGACIYTHAPLWIWSAGIAAFSLWFAAGIRSMAMQFFGKSLCSGPRNAHVIALTFDDGPDPSLTPYILDILSEHLITATFFIVASRAQQYPDIVRRIADEGHTIACHDLDHSLVSNFRRKKGFYKDILSAKKIIAEISGRSPSLYRPPVGLTNPHLHPVLRKLNMHAIGWSVSAGDAGNHRLPGIRHIAQLPVRGGDIILLHDSLPVPEYKETILQSVRTLIEDLTIRDFTCTTVDRLLAIPAYTYE